MTFRFGIFVVALIAFAGCSKKSTDDLPALNPVTGKITKGGKAAGKGTVRFDPEINQEYMVVGRVDDSGAFELETLRGSKSAKGAPAGVYKVFFTPDGGGDQLASTPIHASATYTIEAKSNEITIELAPK
jgi:hypothetical protein